MSEIKDLIISYEGTNKELYSASNDKYALISIRARIENGMLIVSDFAREHGPDEKHSFTLIDFDEFHTELVFIKLLEINPDPFKALEILLSSRDTDKTLALRELCHKNGITYNSVYFN